MPISEEAIALDPNDGKGDLVCPDPNCGGTVEASKDVPGCAGFISPLACQVCKRGLSFPRDWDEGMVNHL